MPFVNTALDDVVNIRKQGVYLAQGSNGSPTCANKPTADDWYYLIAFTTHFATRFLVFAVKSNVSNVYGTVVDSTASSVSWTTLI